MVPFRRLAPSQFRPRSVRRWLEWAGEGQFERLCWAWTAMNRSMREQGSGSSRFSVVRYEDLFDPLKAGPTLQALCALVGFDADELTLARLAERRVNAGKRTPEVPAWEDWPAAERARLVRVCSEEAARYGYRLDGDVREPGPFPPGGLGLTPAVGSWHASAVG
jgi:hypothetical protein